MNLKFRCQNPQIRFLESNKQCLDPTIICLVKNGLETSIWGPHNEILGPTIECVGPAIDCWIQHFIVGFTNLPFILFHHWPLILFLALATYSNFNLFYLELSCTGPAPSKKYIIQGCFGPVQSFKK